MQIFRSKKSSPVIESSTHHIDIDTIFRALSVTCDILDEIGCEYFLAGGTLLGAKRNGDLIAHDVDFDIDCLASDEQKILDSVAKFAEFGLELSPKYNFSPRNYQTFERTTVAMYSCSISVKFYGKHVGDISIFTVFSDGIARRFNIDHGIYYNPKMSIPAWYYAGEEYLTIRGKTFRSVREPALVLEKIYGDDWYIELKPGEFAEGRNKYSGSVGDANIEMLIMHALQSGWLPETDGPVWPQKINWISWPPEGSKNWILLHEPAIRQPVNDILQKSLSMINQPHDTHSRLYLMLSMVAAKSLQDEFYARGVNKKDISVIQFKIPMSLAVFLRSIKRFIRRIINFKI